MLFMCLPFVIYSASMQMFFDSLGNAAPARKPTARIDDDR